MRIAIDAMGGDRAPEVLVQGAIQALKDYREGLEIILVGRKDALERGLEKYGSDRRISIVHAPEVISMEDKPTVALRSKKDSSISVAMRLQKNGLADAVVSAGSTGATMATSFMELGKLRGVGRPAIAVTFPCAYRRYCTVLDVGANSECRPENLYQFGVMGSLYVSRALGIENPEVGLLSIGEEKSKGNPTIVEAHKLLANSNLNFIGNIEGKDILAGAADVVVCDGFVGNIILKFTESIIHFLIATGKDKFTSSLRRKIGTFLLMPAFEEVRRDMDYQEYGGAPLLGINGVTVICHGRSSPKAIRSAIRVAKEMVEGRVNDHIKEQVEKEQLSGELKA